MARDFERSSSEYIDTSIGALDHTGSGGSTFAAIIFRESAATNQTLISLSNATPAFRARFYINSSNQLTLNVNTGTTSSYSPTWSTSEWWLVAVTKAGGSAIPRFHVFDMAAGTWAHAAGSGAGVGDWGTPGGTGVVQIGRNNATQAFDGRMALAGAWKRELSDAQVETLAGGFRAWLAQKPDGLWPLNQAAVATTVVDWTGGGANQTAISGTTISADHPLRWRWGGTIRRILHAQGGGAAAVLEGASAGTSTAGASALALNHAMVAASTGTSTAAASSLTQTQPLIAASDGVSTAVASNLTLDHPLETAVVGTSTAGADRLVGPPAVLEAASDGTSIAAATELNQTQPLAAASTGTSTATAGELNQTQPLAATSTGVSTAAATELNQTQPLDGASVGTSTAGASHIVLPRALDGATTGTSTAEGALGTSGVGLLSGSSTGTSTALASNIALTASLRVALNGNSQPTYATWLNFLAQPVAGSSTGTSTVTADLTVLVPLEASSTGTSTAGADALTQTQPLIGSSAGTSTAGATELLEDHELAGASDGVSTALASMLVLAHAMEAAATGTSTVAGDLVIVRPSFGSGPSGGLGAPSGGGQGATQGPNVIPGTSTSGMSVPGQR